MTNEEMEKIIKKYQGLVFTICYQLVHDTFEAQNLAQETFLSAYMHIDSCHPEQQKAWLARIASNKAKDFLKSAYARKTEFLTEDNETLLLNEDTSPEDIYISNEEKSMVNSTIYNLKEPYKQVAILYFIKGKKTGEVASILNRPVKTVQTQLCRAKIILQNLLKGGG